MIVDVNVPHPHNGVPHRVGVLHHLCIVLFVCETHRLVHHGGVIGDHVEVVLTTRGKVIAGSVLD